MNLINFKPNRSRSKVYYANSHQDGAENVINDGNFARKFQLVYTTLPPVLAALMLLAAIQ